MVVIADWTPDKAARFRQALVAAQFRASTPELFDDAAIEAILDRHDRAFIQVYSMGDDPRRHETFLRGDVGDYSGAQLLEMVRAGRLWVNVRRLERVSPAYAAFGDALRDALAACNPGAPTRAWHHKLIVSSPRAQVFYHLDPMEQLLWQLRGRKTVYVYPNRPPYIQPEDVEAIVLQAKEEELVFNPAFDEAAEIIELEPGAFLSWPQYTPHRVVNAPEVNVSISSEYFVHTSRVRAGSVYLNGLARRHLGARPGLVEQVGPIDTVKWMAARGLRAVNAHRAVVGAAPVAFTLDPEAPGCVRLTAEGERRARAWAS